MSNAADAIPPRGLKRETNMGHKELKYKYKSPESNSIKTREALNRAVRQEIDGGDVALNLLTMLLEVGHSNRVHLHPFVDLIHNDVATAVDMMRYEVARRYDIEQPPVKYMTKTTHPKITAAGGIPIWCAWVNIASLDICKFTIRQLEFVGEVKTRLQMILEQMEVMS